MIDVITTSIFMFIGMFLIIVIGYHFEKRVSRKFLDDEWFHINTKDKWWLSYHIEKWINKPIDKNIAKRNAFIYSLLALFLFVIGNLREISLVFLVAIIIEVYGIYWIARFWKNRR